MMADTSGVTPRDGAYAPLDPDLIRREVPATMQSAPRWLVWRAIEKPGAKKPSKVPHYCDGSPRRGALDTAQDLGRLSDLETALAVYASGQWAGIGFALGPDGSGQVWQGCDFDDLRAHPDFQHLAESSGGYVEWSPSGNGLHAIGLGAPFAALGSNTSGLEAYCAGRYFAVTGQSLGGDPIDLAPYVARVLAPRHGRAAAEKAATGESGKIPEGGRNAHLYRLGCSLRAKGLEGSVILAALLAENRARCDPPLGDDEVTATAGSAAHWAPGVSPGYAGGRSGPESIPDSEIPTDSRPVPPAPPKAALKVVGGTDHDPRPTIQIEGNRLPQNTDEAEGILMEPALGLNIFQHGSRLIRVGEWKFPNREIVRPVGSGVLLELSAEWLVDEMTRAIQWQKWDSRRAKWSKCDAPTRVAHTLLARVGGWRFPALLGFCDSPTLAPDGRLISRGGFDPGSGLFLVDPPEIEPIGRVTREDAQEASKDLVGLFPGFPFVSRSDQSAFIAMVMTALLRRSLPSAPISCIDASTPGTGKSMLADCISVILTGRQAPVAAIGQDAEELEKRLDSILLKGDSVCLFDNVDRAVKSDVLCQVATQPHKTIRVMGLSKMVTAPTNVFLVMTGNNLTLLGDLTRRVLVCHLDAGVERPELRKFDSNAVDVAMANRAEAIRDALVISAAYIQGGCPDVGATPYGSFDLWDRMVRRPLIWAGWPDPLSPAEDMRGQDHEYGGMVEMLRAWWAVFPDQAVSSGELYEAISERQVTMSGGHEPRYPALTGAAVEVMGALGKWSSKDLGYRLRQWSGRIMEGHRIVKDKRKTARGTAWRVEISPGVQQP